jgi:hypothetical protein
METIYEDKQKLIKITVDSNYDQKFLDFAENILYGTNGVIYKSNHVDAEFKKFKNPLFVSLKVNDELIGIRAINHKQIHQNNFTYDIFYKSILGILPEKMNKGYGTLILNKLTEYIYANYDKVILFAHVEEANKRSGRAVQKADYSYMATFLAVTHICLVPKLNKNVFKLDNEDESKILTLLNNQYCNHSFVGINDTFNAETYYVFKENNEIKAGLQVKELSWSFLKFPGLYGFIMMKIVPKIPGLKKIFNPKKHSYLDIGNIYIADSKCFSKLLDTVLYRYNLNTSMAYLNPNSNVDSKIIKEMKKGILSAVASKLNMLYKAKNISLNEIQVTPDNCCFLNF